MTDTIIQPDNKDQQKTNRNLAIWIGVGALGSFILLYVLFFVVMFTKPGLLFKIMPMPTIIDEALSDGSKTYLLSQKVDMSTVDFRAKSDPRITHFLSVLNGAEPGAPQEILPYDHASGGGSRLLLVSQGIYRIHDGSRWTEERSETIGKDPVGLLAPAGVYVLSNHESVPRLNLIAVGTAADIPLPAEYLAWYKGEQCNCSCAKLVWYMGRLCLFWKGTDTISWTILDGNSWAPTATSPHSGGYDVLADYRNLYLFQREGEGPDRRLTYTVFSDNAWSAPVQLSVKGGFTDWDVFLQQGKLKLFVQRITTQTLYTIDKGALVDPVKLKGPFNFPATMGIAWMALWSGITTAISFLAVFGVSAIIRRFKKRIWQEQEKTYEFASLFRRFSALMIDKLILFIPLGIVIARAMHGLDDLPDDPFQFMVTIFSAFALYFGGSFLYHWFLEGVYGQTVGKRICGIRVLKADFSRCGLQAGFIRNILRIADCFFYYLVAAIALAANMKWQRIGDLVAETVVVKEKS